MKIAVVHEMLIKMWWAENVVKDILELYPEADLYTLIYDEKKVEKMFPIGIVKHVPKLTQSMFRFFKHQRFALPFMARAVESLDLSQYDLVIASSSSFAHWCITKPETLFVVYYHTPSRYLWDWTFENRKDMSYWKIFKKLLLIFLDFIFHSLRIWDYQAWQRWDIIIANARQVQQRIKKYYRRDSQIIYPGVYSDIFSIWEKTLKERDYYVIVSALTEFKKIDIAIRAFNNMTNFRLIVIWDWFHRKHLESIAWPNIEFLWYKHWEFSAEIYKNARWSIMCNKDDFWIVPVEAMCAWVPVFGLRDWGLVETNVEWLSWEFFNDPNWIDFISKFKVFHQNIEDWKYDRIKIRNHALKFSKERFLQEFKNVVDENIKR